MPILFRCDCGKRLQADDALAGRMTRCPQCQAVLKIPRPVGEGEPVEDTIQSALTPEPGGRSDGSAEYDPEPPAGPPIPALTPAAPVFRPSLETAASRLAAPASSGSIREYAYLLLGLALIPLVFSLLEKDESKTTIGDRIEATLQEATPEQLQRAQPILTKNEGVSLDELLRVMPEGRLLGAHLPRDSAMHWIYAAVTAAAFLILTLAFFSVERAIRSTCWASDCSPVPWASSS